MIPFLIRTVCVYGGFVAAEVAAGLYKEWKMRREFEQYQNENGGTVSAHQVTEETAGSVTVVGGQGHEAVPGEYLIETDRPDVYQVAPNLDGYVRDDSEPTDSEGDDGDFPFDPNEHTVTEVLSYLSDSDPDERERVIAAERDGKNRTGVVNYDR